MLNERREQEHTEGPLTPVMCADTGRAAADVAVQHLHTRVERGDVSQLGKRIVQAQNLKQMRVGVLMTDFGLGERVTNSANLGFRVVLHQRSEEHTLNSSHVAISYAVF